MFYIIGFYTAITAAVILLFLFIRSVEIINWYEDYLLHHAELRRRKEPEEVLQVPCIAKINNNDDDDFWEEYIRCECASSNGGIAAKLKDFAENFKYEFRLFIARYFIRMPKEIKCRIRKFYRTYILQDYLKYL